MEIAIEKIEQLKDIADYLATVIKPGDVFLLKGELGAGKTTFVRFIANALHSKEDVSSPTFTIINKYPADIPIYHIDLYRIEDELAIMHLDLESILLNSSSVCFIEWAERLGIYSPSERMEMTFNYGRVPVFSLEEEIYSERKIEVTAFGSRYAHYMEGLHAFLYSSLVQNVADDSSLHPK